MDNLKRAARSPSPCCWTVEITEGMVLQSSQNWTGSSSRHCETTACSILLVSIWLAVYCSRAVLAAARKGTEASTVSWWEESALAIWKLAFPVYNLQACFHKNPHLLILHFKAARQSTPKICPNLRSKEAFSLLSTIVGSKILIYNLQFLGSKILIYNLHYFGTNRLQSTCKIWSKSTIYI